MDITLNGQIRSVPKDSSLQALAEQYAKDTTRVVAELDGAIITRDAWSRTALKAGSKVELVTFVGGG
ncbi:MAG: sulfur carrier protein ThiS [Candidatus Omnitrophica bacterium]|nr:sulfur carrier protein ThiS [Candidatus Omnitrophota bacterium]